MSIISSPHIHPHNSITRVMLTVCYALLPGMAAHIYFFGTGLVINMAITIATALLTEAWVMKLRQRPIQISLMDGSALLTAMLLALTLPPMVPWWIPFIGTAFAMIFAKHLYGGLGQNPFNPAMVGFAVLLIAFPQEMTRWIPPQLPESLQLGFVDFLRYSFTGLLPAGYNYDALTMATPLDNMKVQISLGQTMADIKTNQIIMGKIAGKGWEWINLMFLLGGVWLIIKRIISWHIPVALLAGLALSASIGTLLAPDSHTPPLFHLFGGATMLGAFFIATDPVTASTTPRGRLIYGFCIGILIYIIRTWGGYPDGVAFAVLLLNMAVPTIDYYTQPRVFGHDGK